MEEWIDDKTPESSYIEKTKEIIGEPENNEEETEIQTMNKDSQLELEMKIRFIICDVLCFHNCFSERN